MTIVIGSGVTFTISSGQTSSGLDVLEGGVLDVLAGGTAVDMVLNGGSGVIDSGGEVVSATIERGVEAVYGSARLTDIEGGEQHVYAGGVAVSTTIEDGSQAVYGGIVSGTKIGLKGVQTLYHASGLRGIAISTTIESGGVQSISFESTASDTRIEDGGIEDVGPGDHPGASRGAR